MTFKSTYIVSASCGEKYSCALSNKGILYGWGKGNYEFTEDEA